MNTSLGTLAWYREVAQRLGKTPGALTPPDLIGERFLRRSRKR